MTNTDDQGSPSANATVEGIEQPIETVGAGEAPHAEVDHAAKNNGIDLNQEALFNPHKFDLLNDVYVMLSIEIGRAQIKIRDLLSLSKGSIVELNKLAGEPVDVYANGRLISMGNIVTANGKYCVKLVSLPKAEDNKSEAKSHDK